MSEFPNDIETAISKDEAQALLDCAQGRHVILEIGSAYGFSTVLLAGQGRLVLSVDPHTHYGSWEAFLENLERYSASVLPFRATNRQLLPYMGDNSVDMAFIDGDHSYEACLYDVLNCLRIVRPGGIIAVHDYSKPRMTSGNDGNVSFDVGFPGVARAVDEHLTGRLVGTLFIAEV